MSKFFENITDSLNQWYDGLTDRERRMTSIFAICAVVVLVAGTLFFAMSKINTKRELLSRNKAQLAEIKELESAYNLAKERHERELRRIRRNDVSLFTFIQDITSRLGLAVKDLTEQRRTIAKSNIVEISVRVNLNKLSIDKVSRVIEELESPESNAPVKVTKLKINKRHDEPELLDLQLTVSTWKST
jgi:type II secretory pathway component PulM